MAKLYSQLKALAFSSERKPVEALTKQQWTDALLLIRGKDEGIPAWHCILVPHDKLDGLKSRKAGDTIDCTEFGREVKYRNDNGGVSSFSGWGINPPQSLITWLHEHYDDGVLDKNTMLEYENDDIRLCAMQRMTSDQLLGIFRCYHKQDHFHYIDLNDDCQSTLAYRAGIRKFDQLICLNGINIEEDTFDQLAERFKTQLHLPVQMLVCSPASYHHYKSNNILIHSDLPTVQHLKPVFDISSSITSDVKQNFYVIQWENSQTACVVPQVSVFKSADYTRVNDICIIEIEGQYRKGKIRFKGSQDECDHFLTDVSMQSINGNTDWESISKVTINSMISLEKILLDEKTRFEDLPNELMYNLFNYLTLANLHHAFSSLNCRLTELLLSRHQMSLIFDENIDPLLIKVYGSKIMHLKIDTSNPCDLNELVNLHSLIILNRNSNHIIQIRPKILSNLVYLSFRLRFDFKPPKELVDEIFSNQFPSLRYVRLGRINKYSYESWSISPSLQTVTVSSHQSTIVRDILTSCPNLEHLQLHLLNNSNNILACSSSFFHSLQRFTLWSNELELTSDLIDNLLSYMLNLTQFYLQTECRTSFVQLITNIFNQLHHLTQFDCFVKECLMKNERVADLNDIHQISSSFNRIQCIKDDEYARIFATK